MVHAGITEANFGEGAKVLSNGTGYWLASRYANCNSSYATFGLRYAYSHLNGSEHVFSDGYTYDGDISSRLRSVVSLKSSVKIEASSTASSSTGIAHHITQI